MKQSGAVRTPVRVRSSVPADAWERSPVDPTGPTFSSEQERAQKAIEEFQKVAAKYAALLEA